VVFIGRREKEMRAGLGFRCGRGFITSVMVSLALLLAIGLRPSLAADAPDVSGQDSATMIRGEVVDEVDESGVTRRYGWLYGWLGAQEEKKLRANILVRCTDFEAGNEILGETRSDKEGKFTLTIAPSFAKKIRCSIVAGDAYETDEKIIQGGRETMVVFTLKFVTIPELKGWIQIPGDLDIHKVLIQVRQSNGVMISERPGSYSDDKGKIIFKNVKAGPATMEYSYDGLGMGVVQRFLMAGSDVSPTLRFAWFPSALILLIPGIVVLVLLVGMTLWWTRDSDSQHRLGDPLLMLASLVLWGATFTVLWLFFKSREGSGLHFFHPTLSFSLAVPIFGFIGALVFVIDLFRAGGQGVPNYKEFAFRLVLAPYVAIVTVLLFGGTFQVIDLKMLGPQATVAFFSGFLLVLVLQSLAEKGNELLGQWRTTSRYEPSEIGREFGLRMDEDVKLQKANLTYLHQLGALSEEELRALAKQTELGEGFLIGLRNRWQQGRRLATVGEETRKKLNQEGVRTVEDVAFLSPERIQQIATNQHLDPDVLTAYSEACKRQWRQAA
jgi:hypothetical protein